ncbi:MAG: ATP-dependent helicase [Acidimicrobiales bacterium]
MSNNDDKHLNEDQEAAVRSEEPAIVLVASAGSGKTEVTARRVERLLTESPGESFRILALSYTLKAADELGHRFRARLGQLHRRVDTNTVHGFAHALLRQQGTRIGLPVEPEVLVRDEDRAELLARWLTAEGKPVPDDLSSLFHRIDLERARLTSSPLVEDWHAAMTSAGALDYASMLSRATELLELPSARRQLARLYAHVIVDEAQNLTPAQYQLLKALIGPPSAEPSHIPAMLVGDEKQSIVSFAGADPELMSVFAKEYGATRLLLRQNFRSAAAIAALGDLVARRLGHAADESSVQAEYAAPGTIVVQEAPDEEAEAQYVADWIVGLLEGGVPEAALAPGESPVLRPEDVAVLARSAAGLRSTKSALERAGLTPAMASSPDEWLSTSSGKVAFEIVALQSASTHLSTHWQLARLLSADEADVRSAQDVAAVLSSHADPEIRMVAPLATIDSAHVFMLALGELEAPGDADDRWLAAWDADCEQLLDAWRSFLERMNQVEQTWGNFRLHVSRQQRGDDLAPGVRLLTIHKAQGREYRAVAVVGLNDGQLPDFRASSDDERLSELRTFYVAVTRPGRALLLTRPRSRQTRYGPRASDPSPYLQLVATAEH